MVGGGWLRLKPGETASEDEIKEALAPLVMEGKVSVTEGLKGITVESVAATFSKGAR